MKLQIVQLSCLLTSKQRINWKIHFLSSFSPKLQHAITCSRNTKTGTREKAKKKERKEKRNKKNERSLSTFSRWNQRDGLVKADKTNLPPRSEIFSIAPINRKFTFASAIKIFLSIVYRSIRSTRDLGTFFYTNNFTDQMAKCIIPVTNCANMYCKFQYMWILY